MRCKKCNKQNTKSVLKIRRGLQYIVSNNFIVAPKNVVQVIEAFQQESIWKSFGLSEDCLYRRESVSYCLFPSLKSMDLIKENISSGNRTFLMDATFNMVPQGCFNQNLVYIQYFNEIKSEFYYVKQTAKIFFF